MKVRGRVPVNFTQQVAGWTWATGCSTLTPALSTPTPLCISWWTNQAPSLFLHLHFTVDYLGSCTRLESLCVFQNQCFENTEEILCLSGHVLFDFELLEYAKAWKETQTTPRLILETLTGWWGEWTDELCVLSRDKLTDRKKAGTEGPGDCASYTWQ